MNRLPIGHESESSDLQELLGKRVTAHCLSLADHSKKLPQYLRKASHKGYATVVPSPKLGVLLVLEERIEHKQFRIVQTDEIHRVEKLKADTYLVETIGFNWRLTIL